MDMPIAERLRTQQSPWQARAVSRLLGSILQIPVQGIHVSDGRDVDFSLSSLLDVRAYVRSVGSKPVPKIGEPVLEGLTSMIEAYRSGDYQKILDSRARIHGLCRTFATDLDQLMQNSEFECSNQEALFAAKEIAHIAPAILRVVDTALRAENANPLHPPVVVDERRIHRPLSSLLGSILQIPVQGIHASDRRDVDFSLSSLLDVRAYVRSVGLEAVPKIGEPVLEGLTSMIEAYRSGDYQKILDSRERIRGLCRTFATDLDQLMQNSEFECSNQEALFAAKEIAHIAPAILRVVDTALRAENANPRHPRVVVDERRGGR